MFDPPGVDSCHTAQALLNSVRHDHASHRQIMHAALRCDLAEQACPVIASLRHKAVNLMALPVKFSGQHSDGHRGLSCQNQIRLQHDFLIR